MNDYDRRGAPAFSPDLLARLSLALRAALAGEREEATLLPLTREFCRAARGAGIPPEGVVTAFKQALGPPPPRAMEGRFFRIREHLITQCIAAYYAPTLEPGPVEQPAPFSEPRPYAAVVDDDPVIVALLTYILRPAFEVQQFDDARQALAAFYARRPDLVVLDIHLPDYSGPTLLGVLRSDARLKGVPAIAVSGDDSPSLEGRMREQGFAAFFRKPLLDAAEIRRTAIALAEAAAREVDARPQP
jgi:CheY-like chemotaxis protein